MTHYAAWNQQGNVIELQLSVKEAEELASVWHRGARRERDRLNTKAAKEIFNMINHDKARRDYDSQPHIISFKAHQLVTAIRARCGGGK